MNTAAVEQTIHHLTKCEMAEELQMLPLRMFDQQQQQKVFSCSKGER